MSANQIEPIYQGGQLTSDLGCLHAICCQKSDPNHAEPLYALASTDEFASRIVACVNACAGMDDPKAIISGLSVARDTLQVVAKQRDELLAAWNSACAFIDSHVADPDITQQMVDAYAEFMRHRESIEKVGAGTTAKEPE